LINSQTWGSNFQNGCFEGLFWLAVADRGDRSAPLVALPEGDDGNGGILNEFVHVDLF
jgi:hypothetical protein